MRILITSTPFPAKSATNNEAGVWSASWIGDPEVHGQAAAVSAYRRTITLDAPTTVRIHVSADERYELFLDGRRIGRGPERGAPDNWFYETYELNLAAGSHLFLARTWWIGSAGGAPVSQMTVRPGFLLAAEGPLQAELSTGLATWECVRLSGYQFLPVDPRIVWVGAKLAIHGAEIDWDAQLGRGEGWKKAEIVGRAQDGAGSYGEFARARIWCLRPAMLPPMLEEEVHVGEARHVQKIDSLETRNLPVNSADHLYDEAEAWNQLLSSKASLTIPPRTQRRVIVDLDNYYCAYPQLITTDGEGATIRIHWAESLLENKAKQKGDPPFQPKGNRDQIEGKLFNGVGDAFETHGGNERHFQTLWWEGGRYIEFAIATAEQALVIEKFWLVETHYPYQFENRFEASDTRLAEVIPLALRTLQMCSHETYMDCPYYEQLMYVGDTRLEVLTTYATCRDDRLPRKALTTFDFSRRPDGLTQARYPSQVMQIIPPFSLWWVAMVCDNAMWRDDREFVRARMPGARSVLDAFLQRVNADGLLEPHPGWNFADWVPQWSRGVPPTVKTGISALFNFQLVWILRQMADVETSLGEPELAARDRRNADRIARAASEVFWDEQRGLFADDLAREHFSEHTQCLALLSDSVSDARRQRVSDGLITDPNLSRTTIYFDHYLFETFRVLKLPDRLIERMGLWFDLKRNGLRTTVEMPEPCRSDCHAWGAHPVFHYYATILGIRPAEAGFRTVRIEPQLGSLSFARGTMAHPKGLIRADLSLRDGHLSGEVELPPGVSGTFVQQQESVSLSPGVNRL